MKVEKLKDGEFGHVMAIRNPDCDFKRETNISHKLKASDDFEWGYGGAGPSDFAINILFHFTNGDEAFSRKHYMEFRDEFVAQLPRAGGTIHKESILEFIEKKKRQS